MSTKRIILIFGILAPLQGFAFQCYLTLAKDSCWINYDVKVTVSDVDKNQILTTIEVPKGKSWTRQSFECEAGQKLLYQATFEPTFWQGEQGKVYRAQRFWILPKVIKKETAWEIPVCFPTAFAEVPFPPDAIGNCQCNFNKIPPLKLQQ